MERDGGRSGGSVGRLLLQLLSNASQSLPTSADWRSLGDGSRSRMAGPRRTSSASAASRWASCAASSWRTSRRTSTPNSSSAGVSFARPAANSPTPDSGSFPALLESPSVVLYAVLHHFASMGCGVGRVLSVGLIMSNSREPTAPGMWENVSAREPLAPGYYCTTFIVWQAMAVFSAPGHKRRAVV